MPNPSRNKKTKTAKHKQIEINRRNKHPYPRGIKIRPMWPKDRKRLPGRRDQNRTWPIKRHQRDLSAV